MQETSSPTEKLEKDDPITIKQKTAIARQQVTGQKLSNEL